MASGYPRGLVYGLRSGNVLLLQANPRSDDGSQPSESFTCYGVGIGVDPSLGETYKC
jgi:hypothetical protein